ncbi:MAG: cytochrome b/b6 domain-containing protein [Proteobacteria bacterium]|nr:cytochrome b/b6 domain-containing protein [Pseudomonadota bacterium]
MRLRVWDLPVRLLHWSLVAAVAVAWYSRHDSGALHEITGYLLLALLAARLAWGFCGNRYARFAQFVRTPRATLVYARAAFGGRAPRYLGHNPLGGWMVLALLANLGLLGATGWLYTTDRFWGYGWLAGLHRGLAWALLSLAALHVLGMLWTGRQHRENLVRAMITGDKEPPGRGDVV